MTYYNVLRDYGACHLMQLTVLCRRDVDEKRPRGEHRNRSSCCDKRLMPFVTNL